MTDTYELFEWIMNELLINIINENGYIYCALFMLYTWNEMYAIPIKKQI